MDRYHWTVLPQGMKNSPTMCQSCVAKAIQPIRQSYPNIYMYHYMDDLLLAGPTRTVLEEALQALKQALQDAGLQIAPE